jgi:hypothetical protein
LFQSSQVPALSSGYGVKAGASKTNPVHNFLRLFTLN